MEKKLNAEVEKKFDLIGVTPGQYNFAGYGQINLCAITVQDATDLVKAGFPYLAFKKKEEPEAKQVKAQ